MNCKAIQRRLLALNEPDTPTPGLQAHLDSCPRCQETQRRLVQIERHIHLLPVPETSAKAALLAEFRSETTAWERMQFHIRNLKQWQVTAAGLAAAVLVCVLIWSIAPTEDKTQPRPLAAKSTSPDVLLTTLMQRNLKLALANSARDQVETLADLAEDLRGQTRPLFRYGEGKEGKESLKELADSYSQVIRTGVSRAGKLPGEMPRTQVKQVLTPIVLKLLAATDDADQLAQQVPGLSAEHPLYTISFAARNGKEQLAMLLGQQAGLPREAHKVTYMPSRPPTDDILLRRLEVRPLLFVAAKASGHAESTAPALNALEQARRFQRNRKLILSFVNCSTSLAEQDDPVQRAASATTVLAERLAEEISTSAKEHDGYRIAELGEHFRTVLVRNVAFNLTTATIKVPKGAPGEPAMIQIGDQVKRITEQLDEVLVKYADANTQDAVQKALTAVGEGRSAVYKSLHGRGTY